MMNCLTNVSWSGFCYINKSPCIKINFKSVYNSAHNLQYARNCWSNQSYKDINMHLRQWFKTTNHQKKNINVKTMFGQHKHWHKKALILPMFTVAQNNHVCYCIPDWNDLQLIKKLITYFTFFSINQNLPKTRLLNK